MIKNPEIIMLELAFYSRPFCKKTAKKPALVTPQPPADTASLQGIDTGQLVPKEVAEADKCAAATNISDPAAR